MSTRTEMDVRPKSSPPRISNPPHLPAPAAPRPDCPTTPHHASAAPAARGPGRGARLFAAPRNPAAPHKRPLPIADTAPVSAPHVLHVFPSFEPGGSQRRTTALMAGFGDAFRHTVVSLGGREDARSMLPPDFPLTLAPWPRVRGFRATQKQLAALFHEHAPDLVCTYNWGAIEVVLAATRAGLPVVHHEDGFGPDEARRLKLRRIWARRFILRGARAVVVPSFNLGRIASARWKVPPGRLHVVPNGVELERFEPQPADVAALRSELEVPKGAFVIGSVGHLRAEKNFARLFGAADLAAADLACPVHVVLVGDGPERTDLESLARSLEHASVHFAGHRENCAPAYGLMDVFCLSSDTEQMPISLVEAMASGTPAVCTDVGDIARMVPADHARFVVPLVDPHEASTSDGDPTRVPLAARLVELANDPDLRARCAEEGRAKAHAEYAFDTMLARYRAIWSEAP